MSIINIAGISGAQLLQFIEKIERLELEKADLMEVVRETYAEAKAQGFDITVMRQMIKRRKMKKEDLLEQEELLNLYSQAIGEIAYVSPEDEEAA